jgi:hypothetical protein
VSLDIFISAMTDDEADRFDRAIVERAFKAMAVDQSGDYWNLQTPQQEMTSVTISMEETSRVSRFSVNRPPDYHSFPEFWNAMFEVLQQTNTVLFWPAHGPIPHCCLANPDMIPQVPAELIDAIGKTAFVTSGAEREAVVDRSFS